MRLLDLVLGLSWTASISAAAQTPLASSSKSQFGKEDGRGDSTPYYKLNTKIERVAVIGAGPNGLLHASTLIENGFQVRLFERAPNPGGNWLYTDKTPIRTPFPYVTNG